MHKESIEHDLLSTPMPSAELNPAGHAQWIAEGNANKRRKIRDRIGYEGAFGTIASRTSHEYDPRAWRPFTDHPTG